VLLVCLIILSVLFEAGLDDSYLFLITIIILLGNVGGSMMALKMVPQNTREAHKVRSSPIFWMEVCVLSEIFR